MFAEAGHDVAISAFYGVQGGVLGWKDPRSGRDFKVYGNHLHPYGDDIVTAHATDHFGGNLRDGLILFLIDVWVFTAATYSRVNLACWTPVDHRPCPPRVSDFFQVSGASPVAMSRFGEQMLKDAGLNPLYAPHGINTTVYQPQPRQTARDLLGIHEDVFLVGMVAANKGFPSRKGFTQAFLGFKEFHRAHPNARLYLHTDLTGMCQGVNLPTLANAVGLPAEAVVYCDQYRYVMGAHAPEYLAMAYSAMDVLLNPAYGEGFGIPIVEAQACGTPVIVTDHTAMTELCGPGWLLAGDEVWTEQAAWWKVPYVSGIVEALEDAYSERGTPDAEVRSGLAREFALQYDARTVMDEHWGPVLGKLEERVVPLQDPAELIAA